MCIMALEAATARGRLLRTRPARFPEQGFCVTTINHQLSLLLIINSNFKGQALAQEKEDPVLLNAHTCTTTSTV